MTYYTSHDRARIADALARSDALAAAWRRKQKAARAAVILLPSLFALAVICAPDTPTDAPTYRAIDARENVIQTGMSIGACVALMDSDIAHACELEN